MNIDDPMNTSQHQETESTSGTGPQSPQGERWKNLVRYLLSVFFLLAGANHFISPEWYLQNQMPSWVPFPMIALYGTGIAEMLGGLGLLLPKTRLWAGYGLIALLIGVFPANIHMASEAMHASGWSGETIGLLLRLPFQAVFIVGVLWSSRDRAISLS